MIRKMLCNLFLLCMFTMLAAGCSRSYVDRSAFENLAGDYPVVETEAVGGWWHLYIGKSDDIPCYFSIYDAGAGNPGVSGEIISLDDTSLSIRIDQDMFENLPAEWTLTGDNAFLTLEYTCEGNLLTLTNNHLPVVFEKETAPAE